MKHKLVLILSAALLLPLLTTFWMGLSALDRDRSNALGRLQEAVRGRLAGESDRLQAAWQKLQADLEPSLTTFAATPGPSTPPLVKQAYRAENDRLVYPEPGNATVEEDEGRRRLLKLVEQGVFSRAPAESTYSSSRTAQTFWALGPMAGEGFYLARSSGRDLAVFELNRSAVLARLLDALTESPGLDPGQALILRDDHRRIFFQRGRDTVAAGQQPILSLAAGPPLTHWTWEYYVSADQRPQLSEPVWWLIVAASLSFVALVGFLGWTLHREIGRELREAGRKVSFVNQVSHELKTPLTNIRLYADLLKGALDPRAEKLQGYLAVITAESDRLSRMIHNVLTFARQDKADQPRRRETDLNAVCQDVLLSFAPSFRIRNLEVDWQAGALPVIWTDPDWVGQIVANLLSNAEKYAGGGRKIAVKTERVGPNLEVSVRDWGPGIPARDRDRIFLPFQRLSEAVTEGTSGAGLGLTISRQLAQRLGGSLQVREVEAGACFVLLLPLEGGRS